MSGAQNDASERICARIQESGDWREEVLVQMRALILAADSPMATLASETIMSGALTEASKKIDARIQELGDWRGEALARMRGLIRAADPQVEETVKWGGVPVWEHAGILCTGETYKTVVKLTFARGAALEDPAGLFNASLTGGTRRAIDIPQGGTVDEAAFKALIQAAVALNLDKKAGGRKTAP